MELNPLIGFKICDKLRNFITDFSGAMKALKLKLGTHIDSRLLNRIYQNQVQGPITRGVTSLNRFCKFLFIKIFCSTFLKNCKGSKVEMVTHMESRLMYRFYRNHGLGPITHGFKSLDRFYCSMLLCSTVIYLVSMN